jgi:ABC-type multidrug transport system fused ATPase/permease subunit
VVGHLARDRSVVVVAHRLSTIQRADHVVVLDGGRVVDTGTHLELMQRCAHYRELVLSQQWLEPQTAGAL